MSSVQQSVFDALSAVELWEQLQQVRADAESTHNATMRRDAMQQCERILRVLAQRAPDTAMSRGVASRLAAHDTALASAVQAHDTTRIVSAHTNAMSMLNELARLALSAPNAHKCLTPRVLIDDEKKPTSDAKPARHTPRRARALTSNRRHR